MTRTGAVACVPAPTRPPRVLPKTAAAVLPALIVALAMAGQTRLASAATYTSTMTLTGFTCAGQLCPLVILSVGDTIEYRNATALTLGVVIVSVTPSTTSVPPGGTWSYQATTQLHDAQVVAKSTLPPLLITQLLTVNPLSTATSSSTSSPTSTPTPTATAPPVSTPPASSSVTQPSSSAAPADTPPSPAATMASHHASSTSSSSSTTPAAGTGGLQGGSSEPVPAGPGDGSLLGSGGVQAVQTGGSMASWWWLFILLCGIAAAAASATWWGTRRKTQLATVLVPSETGRPSNDDGPPVTHHRS